MKSLRRHRRIYIFPNQFGILGFALFIITLAAGATYQNNLIFMMAFLILSLGLIAILQTARNLRGIEIVSVYAQSNFPSRTSTARVLVKNTTSAPKMQIDIIISDKKFHILAQLKNISPASTELAEAKFKLPAKRGIYNVTQVKIKTTHPYALFNSWSYHNIEHNFAVYPEPIGTQELPNAEQQTGDDYSGHRIYTPSDNTRRIDWKIYSRRNELFIKEFSEGGTAQIHLDINDTQEDDTELKLSQLSFWTKLASENDHEFSLKLNNISSSVAGGDAHYHHCMHMLASYK